MGWSDAYNGELRMNEKIHLIKDVAIKDEQSLLGLIIQNTNPEQTQRHTGFIFIKNKVPFLAHFGTNQGKHPTIPSTANLKNTR